MNRTQPRSFPRRTRRFLLATLLSLPLAGACSSSSDDAATPITFSIEVTALDGKAPTDTIPLRCDHKNGKALGTLAVAFSITSDPENNFVLRPNNACGTSTRCGYVQIQALSASDEVLGSVDTASTAGLLELDPTRLAELAKIELNVIRGFDQLPLLNPDSSTVTTEISPSFMAPGECVDELVGAGGSDSGAAGAATSAGASAGGESSMALGGAAGAATSAGAGGAAAAGAPAAGGAAGEPSGVAGMGGV